MPQCSESFLAKVEPSQRLQVAAKATATELVVQAVADEAAPVQLTPY